MSQKYTSFLKDIAQEELKNAANSLKLNKSPGPDGISNDRVKLIARELLSWQMEARKTSPNKEA